MMSSTLDEEVILHMDRNLSYHCLQTCEGECWVYHALLKERIDRNMELMENTRWHALTFIGLLVEDEEVEDEEGPSDRFDCSACLEDDGSEDVIIGDPPTAHGMSNNSKNREPIHK